MKNKSLFSSGKASSKQEIGLNIYGGLNIRSNLQWYLNHSLHGMNLFLNES